ncbi:MAG: hypothetical protein AMXMBFR64_13720 [Myxococcales bacterium]
MKLRRRSRGRVTEAVIDITSLIDAAFILIIFLLISTTFKRKEHAFSVRLPTAAHKEVVVEVERNSVYVSREGDLFYLAVGGTPVPDGPPAQGRKVTAEELRKELEALVEKDPKTRLSILAQKGTDYQHIITVMSEATRAGVQAVQLPYEYARPEGEQPPR